MPGELAERWPKDGQGAYVPGGQADRLLAAGHGEAIINSLLDSCGIPHFTRYPHYGGFGNLMLGVSAEGVDVYVPETMLEDAKNIIEGESEDESYKEEYQYWLDSPALDEEEWKELSAIADDEKEIESRFYAPLEFGTAGLRGIMATGLNRMNVHVIRWATQAFAEVVKAEGEAACEKGVVVCYDCRLNSERFAREAAGVMAANGVKVRIFDALRPTPELSFAVLHYGAQAGINITASHNPREYNGYKVYWSDGAQLPPQHAAAVAAEMGRIDIFKDVHRMDFDEAVAKGLANTRSSVDRRGLPRRGHEDERQLRCRARGGRRLQDSLHALPRRGLQAGPRGAAPPWRQAPLPGAEADGDRRQLPDRKKPEPGEIPRASTSRWTSPSRWAATS